MKNIIFLSLSCFLMISCSDNDSPQIPEEIPSESIEVSLARAIEDGENSDYVNQTALRVQDLCGTWTVSADGIDSQVITFSSSSETRMALKAERQSEAFPQDGYVVAYGRTLFLYRAADNLLESNLLGVYEIVSVEGGQAVLNAHMASAPTKSLKLSLEKTEGDMSVSGHYAYPEDGFRAQDLSGTWEISSVTRIWDGKDILAALKETTAFLGIDRPLPVLTFKEDGVEASVVNYFFCTCAPVIFWGRSFVLYREDLGEHSEHSIAGVYEIESLSSDELVMTWHPGNGDSPRRLVMKR